MVEFDISGAPLFAKISVVMALGGLAQGLVVYGMTRRHGPIWGFVAAGVAVFVAGLWLIMESA